MRSSLLPKLVLMSLLLCQGEVNAISGIGSMTLPGVKRQDIGAMPSGSLAQFIGPLIHARNLVAGLPETTYDPLPCRSNLFYGELATGNPAYQTVKRSLLKQGWQPMREVRGQTLPEMAFQMRKGSFTLLGLWLDVPTRRRSALVMCEQAEEWKPVGSLKAPPGSPALGKTVKFTVQGWHEGIQVLSPVLGFTGRSGKSGQIKAGGVAELPLGVPEKDQLQPISRWKAGFELLDCLSGSPSGTVTISDPKVRLTTVRKLKMGTAANEFTPYLFSSAMNTAVTRIVDTPLIYTSGPVKLTGLLVCPDGERNLTVNLTLPGGWTAVTYQADVPDAGRSSQQLLNWAGTWSWHVIKPS